MKKILLALPVFALLLGCAVASPSKDAVGIPQRTHNPNTPFIYKNGYANYTIVQIPTLMDKDTIKLNELRFHAVSGAGYTKKVMFENFGRWSKEIWFEGNQNLLVWENVKLFEDEIELYTVSASGLESMEQMYASVIVFDAQNRDCLSNGSMKKEKVTGYFAQGIQNLSEDRTFYDAYWEAVGRNTDRKIKQ